jgi:hypothetical protein
MRVQPIADEDQLEDIVKGREDWDEDDLPESPRKEDWDIDLPAQDTVGALEATYMMQYGFDAYNGLTYNNNDSPHIRAQSLQSCQQRPLGQLNSE